MFGAIKVWTDKLRLAYYTLWVDHYRSLPLLADHQRRDLNYNLSQQWMLTERAAGRHYDGIDGQLAWAAHVKAPHVVEAFQREYGMPLHEIFADPMRAARLRVNLAQSIITGTPMPQLGEWQYEMGDFANIFNQAIGL